MTKESSVSQPLNHSEINHTSVLDPHLPPKFSQLHTTSASASRRKISFSKMSQLTPRTLKELCGIAAMNSFIDGFYGPTGNPENACHLERLIPDHIASDDLLTLESSLRYEWESSKGRPPASPMLWKLWNKWLVYLENHHGLPQDLRRFLILTDTFHQTLCIVCERYETSTRLGPPPNPYPICHRDDKHRLIQAFPWAPPAWFQRSRRE